MARWQNSWADPRGDKRRLYESEAAEAAMSVPSDHDVIVHRYAKRRRGFDDLACNRDIVRAWGRVSAGVIVEHRDCGIPRNSVKPDDTISLFIIMS